MSKRPKYTDEDLNWDGKSRRAPQGPPTFYTIEQVAEALEVSTRTVRRWIDAGLLVAHRFGGVIRIAVHDLRAFLAQHRVAC